MPRDEEGKCNIVCALWACLCGTSYGVEARKISADEPDLILYEFCPPILVADMVWPKG